MKDLVAATHPRWMQEPTIDAVRICDYVDHSVTVLRNVSVAVFVYVKALIYQAVVQFRVAADRDACQENLKRILGRLESISRHEYNQARRCQYSLFFCQARVSSPASHSFVQLTLVIL